MPATRIPIDGLWRCLCPAIDGIAIARHPRTVSSRRILLAGYSHRGNLSPRAQPFHSSSRNRTQERWNSMGTVEGVSLDGEPLSRTPAYHAPFTHPPSSQTPRIRSISRLSQGQGQRQKLMERFEEECEGLSITQVHDLLRKKRTERRAYDKVATLVEYLIRVRGERPALIHYDSLIRVNADAMQGSAASVRMLLEDMKEFAIAPDSGLYHGALQALAIHPDYILRVEIMQEMKERWLGLSPEGWHSLVVGLIRDRQYEVALDKLDEMHSDGILVQPWLYDIFMFQLCEAGELDEAFNLLKYRFENSRNEILPTVWYYLVDVFSSAFHYEGVKFIWKRRVETENIVLSDGMTVAVLNLAARYSDPELATSAIRILSGRQSALTAFHYEPLLASYAGSGDLKTAFRVLVIMAKANIEPNPSTTRPLFLKLSESGELAQKAWTELESLVQDGHTIPIAAPNVVLEACIEVGQFEHAVELYKSLHEICESGPNTETFNVLLQGASRQGRKDLSIFLASEMLALGIKPDMLTYDRLILSCLKGQGDFEDAFRYLQEMVEVGADQPDGGWWMRGGTATFLIKRCVHENDARAWDLLDEMARRGIDNLQLRDWVQQNWKGSKVQGRHGHAELQSEDKLTAWSTM
ncbi:pentatricopeptide repeat protein-like protein [Rhexocercosporidium sp. MPI-PUGE-AT-0058]|nr:pentatricopeptide repeat protein-like protein [Rhexocercosporidium sp. MPI-PUGE-AT-0058]